jgi:hypothetical protein
MAARAMKTSKVLPTEATPTADGISVGLEYHFLWQSMCAYLDSNEAIAFASCSRGCAAAAYDGTRASICSDWGIQQTWYHVSMSLWKIHNITVSGYDYNTNHTCGVWNDDQPYDEDTVVRSDRFRWLRKLTLDNGRFDKDHVTGVDMPLLQQLVIRSMPGLTNIVDVIGPGGQQSWQHLEIDGCEDLSQLVIGPNARSVHASRSSVGTTVTADGDTSLETAVFYVCTDLQTLELSKCTKLRNLSLIACRQLQQVNTPPHLGHLIVCRRTLPLLTGNDQLTTVDMLSIYGSDMIGGVQLIPAEWKVSRLNLEWSVLGRPFPFNRIACLCRTMIQLKTLGLAFGDRDAHLLPVHTLEGFRYAGTEQLMHPYLVVLYTRVT